MTERSHIRSRKGNGSTSATPLGRREHPVSVVECRREPATDIA